MAHYTHTYRGVKPGSQVSRHEAYLRRKNGQGLGTDAQPWKSLEEIEADLTW